jgi:hypothetical protein
LAKPSSDALQELRDELFETAAATRQRARNLRAGLGHERHLRLREASFDVERRIVREPREAMRTARALRD